MIPRFSRHYSSGSQRRRGSVLDPVAPADADPASPLQPPARLATAEEQLICKPIVNGDTELWASHMTLLATTALDNCSAIRLEMLNSSGARLPDVPAGPPVHPVITGADLATFTPTATLSEPDGSRGSPTWPALQQFFTTTGHIFGGCAALAYPPTLGACSNSARHTLEQLLADGFIGTAPDASNETAKSSNHTVIRGLGWAVLVKDDSNPLWYAARFKEYLSRHGVAAAHGSRGAVLPSVAIELSVLLWVRQLSLVAYGHEHHPKHRSSSSGSLTSLLPEGVRLPVGQQVTAADAAVVRVCIFRSVVNYLLWCIGGRHRMNVSKGKLRTQHPRLAPSAHWDATPAPPTFPCTYLTIGGCCMDKELSSSDATATRVLTGALAHGLHTTDNGLLYDAMNRFGYASPDSAVAMPTAAAVWAKEHFELLEVLHANFSIAEYRGTMAPLLQLTSGEVSEADVDPQLSRWLRPLAALKDRCSVECSAARASCAHDEGSEDDAQRMTRTGARLQQKVATFGEPLSNSLARAIKAQHREGAATSSSEVSINLDSSSSPGHPSTNGSSDAAVQTSGIGRWVAGTEPSAFTPDSHTSPEGHTQEDPSDSALRVDAAEAQTTSAGMVPVHAMRSIDAVEHAMRRAANCSTDESNFSTQPTATSKDVDDDAQPSFEKTEDLIRRFAESTKPAPRGEGQVPASRDALYGDTTLSASLLEAIAREGSTTAGKNGSNGSFPGSAHLGALLGKDFLRTSSHAAIKEHLRAIGLGCLQDAVATAKNHRAGNAHSETRRSSHNGGSSSSDESTNDGADKKEGPNKAASRDPLEVQVAVEQLVAAVAALNRHKNGVPTADATKVAVCFARRAIWDDVREALRNVAFVSNSEVCPAKDFFEAAYHALTLLQSPHYVDGEPESKENERERTEAYRALLQPMVAEAFETVCLWNTVGEVSAFAACCFLQRTVNSHGEDFAGAHWRQVFNDRFVRRIHEATTRWGVTIDARWRLCFGRAGGAGDSNIHGNVKRQRCAIAAARRAAETFLN